jgi:hypothetical protein
LLKHDFRRIVGDAKIRNWLHYSEVIVPWLQVGDKPDIAPNGRVRGAGTFLFGPNGHDQY